MLCHVLDCILLSRFCVRVCTPPANTSSCFHRADPRLSDYLRTHRRLLSRILDHFLSGAGGRWAVRGKASLGWTGWLAGKLRAYIKLPSIRVYSTRVVLQEMGRAYTRSDRLANNRSFSLGRTSWLQCRYLPGEVNDYVGHCSSNRQASHAPITMIHSSGDVRGRAPTGKAQQVRRRELMPINGTVLPAAKHCREPGAGDCM